MDTGILLKELINASINAEEMPLVILGSTTLKKAAVLGSGVMGSGIAAHLANIGIPVLLLDIVPRKLTEQEEAKGLTLEHHQVRNKLAAGAVQNLLKQKPAPLTTRSNLSLIEVGNLEDDLEKLQEVWACCAQVKVQEIRNQACHALVSVQAARNQETTLVFS